MFVAFIDDNIHDHPGCKVHNLHSADDGEPGEEAMVPPMADSMSTVLAASSLVIWSNVGVLKEILTSSNLFSHSNSSNENIT